MIKLKYPPKEIVELHCSGMHTSDICEKLRLLDRQPLDKILKSAGCNVYTKGCKTTNPLKYKELMLAAEKLEGNLSPLEYTQLKLEEQSKDVQFLIVDLRERVDKLEDKLEIIKDTVIKIDIGQNAILQKINRALGYEMTPKKLEPSQEQMELARQKLISEPKQKDTVDEILVEEEVKPTTALNLVNTVGAIGRNDYEN